LPHLSMTSGAKFRTPDMRDKSMNHRSRSYPQESQHSAPFAISVANHGALIMSHPRRRLDISPTTFFRHVRSPEICDPFHGQLHSVGLPVDREWCSTWKTECRSNLPGDVAACRALLQRAEK